MPPKSPDESTVGAPLAAPAENKIIGIQIMMPVTVFPGKKPGEIIENPTPEQIELAKTVSSCITFITAPSS